MTAYRREPGDTSDSSRFVAPPPSQVSARNLPERPVAAEANLAPSHMQVGELVVPLTFDEPARTPFGNSLRSSPQGPTQHPRDLRRNRASDPGSVPPRFSGMFRTTLLTYENWRRERIARWLDRRGWYLAADAVRSTRVTGGRG